MRKYEENISAICRKNTDFSEKELAIIKRTAEGLKDLPDIEGKDVFLNCVCRDGATSVTVAYYHCEDSMYSISSLGAVVREDDEPGVCRTMWYGIPSNDMLAVSFTTTEGHRLVQECVPLFCEDRVIGIIVKERRLRETEVEEMNREPLFLVVDYDRYPYLRYLDWLAECVDEGVIICNANKKVVFRNLTAKKLYHKYGYINDIYGKNYEDISMNGFMGVGPGIENSFCERETQGGGYYFMTREYCYDSGSEWFYIVIIRDVTRDYLKDEDLVLKSVALREAHHRIKNNLQTVYNLLGMQQRRVHSPDGVAAIQEAKSRIMSISTAYEELMAQGGDQISVRNILESTSEKILRMAEGVVPVVSIEILGDDIIVNADIATNIALVVNELIQNCLKHAFEGRATGRIKVTLKKWPLYSEVTVRDDGVGFIKESEELRNGLGFRIVENIVKSKLKGKLQMTSTGDGTDVTFSFKLL